MIFNKASNACLEVLYNNDLLSIYESRNCKLAAFFNSICWGLITCNT